jgi:TatD DNase family protein
VNYSSLCVIVHKYFTDLKLFTEFTYFYVLDIGANLTDAVYKGIYHGSKKHEADLEVVLERAWNIGMQKIIITGGSLEESREALQLADTHGLFLI